jgi:hypothetical protein
VTNAAELLEEARGLLTRSSPETAGLWPRAAALLGRQALEAALDDVWRAKKLTLATCSTRAQLLCLREYLGDAELAGRVAQAWGALSRACHHHPYELAPVTGELERWLATTAQVIRAAAPGPSPSATG